jgi:Gas vesicle synthesis protein GvpO
MANSESRDGSSESISAGELAMIARDTVASLTGFPAESVSGLQWEGDKWLVTVDVCELERVPSTTDVMATYAVQLDERGGILGYKRTHRFIRGHAEGG